MYTYIHRYRVAIMSSDPYGRSKPLRTFSSCEDALAYGKEACKQHHNVYVEDRIYASQANLERDFTMTSSIVAADWLDGPFALK